MEADFILVVSSTCFTYTWHRRVTVFGVSQRVLLDYDLCFDNERGMPILSLALGFLPCLLDMHYAG